ncbi:MAG: hypothetical protein LBF22_12790 [Deltaproteobacteria bacterium]|nr:hypothetical protein [Deltaproteobacteria bacterium]
MKQIHLVLLSPQVVDIINELSHYTGLKRYLFKSMRTDDRQISDATLLATPKSFKLLQRGDVRSC